MSWSCFLGGEQEAHKAFGGGHVLVRERKDLVAHFLNPLSNRLSEVHGLSSRPAQCITCNVVQALESDTVSSGQEVSSAGM